MQLVVFMLRGHRKNQPQCSFCLICKEGTSVCLYICVLTMGGNLCLCYHLIHKCVCVCLRLCVCVRESFTALWLSAVSARCACSQTAVQFQCQVQHLQCVCETAGECKSVCQCIKLVKTS